MITVLLVDDQALVRAGFAMLVGSQPDLSVVGEAGDGLAAVRAVRTLQPDVVLMDVRMPTMDGVEATREVVAAAPETKVIVLTTFDLDEYAFSALQAGASGFLLKDAPPRTSSTRSGSSIPGTPSLLPRPRVDSSNDTSFLPGYPYGEALPTP